MKRCSLEGRCDLVFKNQTIVLVFKNQTSRFINKTTCFFKNKRFCFCTCAQQNPKTRLLGVQKTRGLVFEKPDHLFLKTKWTCFAPARTQLQKPVPLFLDVVVPALRCKPHRREQLLIVVSPRRGLRRWSRSREESLLICTVAEKVRYGGQLRWRR